MPPSRAAQSRPSGSGALRAAVAGTAVGAVVFVGVLWTAACGLSLPGLVQEDGSVGKTGTDGNNGTNVVDGGNGPDGPSGDGPGQPPQCTTLDASCLAALPAQWQPVSVTDGGCGAHFTSTTLRVNPRVDQGGCACGPFQTVGSFACSGNVSIVDNNGCTNTLVSNAQPGTCTQATANHIDVVPPTASGAAKCVASDDAGTGASTDPLTVCVPGCAADYCGSAPRCILAQGAVPCPQNFTLLTQAGTGADPMCAPCDFAADSVPCTGTVTVFDNDECDDGGNTATYPIGTCSDFTAGYQSVFIQLVPPTPSCNAAAAKGDPGDASLVGVQTICCQ